MVQIAPSILSADFSRLGDEVRDAERGGADMIHIDVMDGHFVPNLTIGPVVVEAIAPLVTIPIDIHLMIEHPQNTIDEFIDALGDRDVSNDYLSIHAESCIHLDRLVHMVKDRGVKVGVALNPSTSLSMIEWLLDEIDLIVIMTVNPGYSGQSFIEGMLPKIRRTRELVGDKEIEILVDGGVKAHNAKRIVEAGASILAAGSAVFNKEASVEHNIRGIREAAK